MNDELHDDPLLATLAAARPAPTAGDDEAEGRAAQALLAGILAPPVPCTRSPRRTRRVRVAAGVLSAAAAITVAVVAVNTVGVSNGHVIVRQQPASADVVAIARASTRAFSSGRATMTFSGRAGRVGAEQGTAQIAFSGRDLEVTTHYDSVAGRPGFDTHNKTVDGQFYLFDQHWIHDTTATPAGSDIFDLDRTLLDVLRPSAGFVVVDTESTANGTIRHLRATNLGALPTLHLVLGPVAGPDVTSLELWVGADDTVQRLASGTKHTETAPACFVQDGVKQCVKPGGKLSKGPDGRITIIPGSGSEAPAKPLVTTATVGVRFTDIGAPISITAPANAVDVAGKG